jgi:MerR family copper efflux transcriptional regulator
MSERLLTIGELARRAGVATSALRYWEELGLLPAPARVSGQRRYAESAVALVGVIVLLRDVGFSLAEQKALVASRGVSLEEWRRLARRKLAELDEQIAKARAAREAIDHALRCPHEDIRECSNFRGLTTARLAGQPLHKLHSHSSPATGESRCPRRPASRGHADPVFVLGLGMPAGRGASYALVAELSSYPGSRHVLDLAAGLARTLEQQRAAEEA